MKCLWKMQKRFRACVCDINSCVCVSVEGSSVRFVIGDWSHMKNTVLYYQRLISKWANSVLYHTNIQLLHTNVAVFTDDE